MKSLYGKALMLFCLETKEPKIHGSNFLGSKSLNRLKYLNLSIAGRAPLRSDSDFFLMSPSIICLTSKFKALSALLENAETIKPIQVCLFIQIT